MGVAPRKLAARRGVGAELDQVYQRFARPVRERRGAEREVCVGWWLRRWVMVE